MFKKAIIFSFFSVILISFSSLLPVFGQSIQLPDSEITGDTPFRSYLPFVVNNITSSSVNLIGVNLEVKSPVMPEHLAATEIDNSIQIATASSIDPFEEVTIIPIAYGDTSPIEQLPAALAGGADIYRTELVNYRISQGGTPALGPTANLFGQSIASSYSTVNILIDDSLEIPYMIVEWVVDALDHLWIVRISNEISEGFSVDDFLSQLQSLVITSEQITKSSSLSEDFITDTTSTAAIDILPAPAWWDGQICDHDDYYAATGLHSYARGTPFDGLIACGPSHTMVPVNFFPTAHGQYEWQCVELAMRYMYLKYNIEPYSANGKYVVSKYPKDHPAGLRVIVNGTISKPPKVGDIISMYPTTTFGHVAIVSKSNVDAYGNGTIEIFEQNGSSTARRNVKINNWSVSGAINWLHKLPTPPGGMVLVPEGIFTMGCDPNHNAGADCFDWQLPLHSVYLDDYFIDKYEVTNAGYKQCVDAGYCSPPSYWGSNTRTLYYTEPEFSIFPVLYVSKENASTFCQWLGKRLPTEAEWEKAARGSTIKTYPWGDAVPTCALANYGGCIGDTNAVGSYPSGQSEYGAMDMAGNVWEWVNDYYSPTYYWDSPFFNPLGPSTGTQYIVRGGDFYYGITPLRVSFRNPGELGSSWDDVGFRCVKNVP